MTNTSHKIAFIGFGEAGSLLAKGLGEAGAQLTACYDILIDDPANAAALRDKAAKHGIAAATSPKQAVAGADIVISAVTTSKMLEAAKAVGPHLAQGQIYLDINSTSPELKREAVQVIETNGADFVEAAVMDLVPPHGHKVPMLLAGEKAKQTTEALATYGMNVTALGEKIGDASSVKMVRSVFMKGFTAILLESLVSAKKLNAEDAVLASLQTTFPEMDWKKLTNYYLPRLIKHARRQSGEMKSVAQTLEEIGIEPITTIATGKRLAWLADKELDKANGELPEGYNALLDLIVKTEAK